MSALDLSKIGILVVDDDQSVRTMLKTMLKALQVQQTFEARDGREALQFLDASPNLINVVICDWSMPGVTGIDLLRQVRSTGSEVPFVMLTGKADKESVIEAKGAGVSAYIAKPFTQIQLEAKLRGVLAASKTKH